MKSTSRLVLIFVLVFAAFIVLPAFLSNQFSLYPLLKNGDILDLFTPLVLIPIYWLLFRLKPQKGPTNAETITFLVLAALWVEGQGLHLAGNAIGHLTSEIIGSDIEKLTYFIDEVLSHYMWHIGVIGLSVLLIYRQWKNPFEGEPAGLGFQTSAGIIHGLNFFVIITEGTTTLIGVPFAVLAALFTFLWGRKNFSQQPILRFFFVTYLVASLLFLGWGIYWGVWPLPEPCSALNIC